MTERTVRRRRRRRGPISDADHYRNVARAERRRQAAAEARANKLLLLDSAGDTAELAETLALLVAGLTRSELLKVRKLLRRLRGVELV